MAYVNLAAFKVLQDKVYKLEQRVTNLEAALNSYIAANNDALNRVQQLVADTNNELVRVRNDHEARIRVLETR